MIKYNALINGIGTSGKTKKYYDEWSKDYDKVLNQWNYHAPKSSSKILKKFLNKNPNEILDLACGTGLFGKELKKIYPKSSIDGADISTKSLSHAKLKKVYKRLFVSDFNKNFIFKKKYNLITCIGSLTYNNNPQKLLLKVSNITKKSGFFIFSHRVDLWQKQNFDKILSDLSNKWQNIFISRKLLYLPKNKDFNNKIKIKIGLLKKI
tara:strand:+ start:1619 stop:2242 length:624 start_codon:yes stop_codon:yes gene_type:complete